MTDSHSKKCGKCVKKHCNKDFSKCSGFPTSDLPKPGENRRLITEPHPGLMNLGKLLLQRRQQRQQQTTIMMTDGIAAEDLSVASEDGNLEEALEMTAQQESDQKLQQKFEERPICRDDDKILQQATDGQISDCRQVKDLCSNEQFGAQLRIACPKTCDSLNPKCANCKNNPGILQEATNGQVQTCGEALDLCDDVKFGPSLFQACPITCDACGLQFSTPPPTPVPVTASEAQQAQVLVFNKINDGSLVEDSGTAALNVATENPKGPRGATDIWGYAYAMVTLVTPHATVRIDPALWPIVWHRPTGHPFDPADYEPYKSSLNADSEAAAPRDDDDGKLRDRRRMTEQAAQTQQAAQTKQQAYDAQAEEVVDDGAYGGDAGYGYTAAAAAPAYAYVAKQPNSYGHADFPAQDEELGYGGYGGGAAQQAYGAAAQGFEAGCRRLVEAAAGAPAAGEDAAGAARRAAAARRHLQYGGAYAGCAAPAGAGYDTYNYAATQAFTPTTIGHVELPKTTINPGVENMLVVGVSAHLTRKFLDANRDIMEWYAYPIAYPKAQQSLSDADAPNALTDNLLQQLDITGDLFRLHGGALTPPPTPAGQRDRRKLGEKESTFTLGQGMGRPTPPWTVTTFGGTATARFSYLILSATVDFEIMCKLKVDPEEYRRSGFTKLPGGSDLDCGNLGPGNIKRFVWIHNIGTILGAAFIIASVLVFVIWGCTASTGHVFGSDVGVDVAPGAVVIAHQSHHTSRAELAHHANQLAQHWGVGTSPFPKTNNSLI